MQSVCADKNWNSMERPDDKHVEMLQAEKMETDLDEEQLITGEVVTSGTAEKRNPEGPSNASS